MLLGKILTEYDVFIYVCLIQVVYFHLRMLVKFYQDFMALWLRITTFHIIKILWLYGFMAWNNKISYYHEVRDIQVQNSDDLLLKIYKVCNVYCACENKE